jgi:hypothetical protein
LQDSAHRGREAVIPGRLHQHAPRDAIGSHCQSALRAPYLSESSILRRKMALMRDW